jgi:hypothetical protein
MSLPATRAGILQAAAISRVDAAMATVDVHITAADMGITPVTGIMAIIPMAADIILAPQSPLVLSAACSVA